MSTPICSCCLAADRKMICIENVELRSLFIQLLRIQPNAPFGFLDSMCYICCWQLQRCQRFARMAHRSSSILLDISSRGLQASQETLTSLNINTINTLTVHTKTESLTDLDTEDIVKHVAVKEETSVERDDESPALNVVETPAEALNDIAKTEDAFVDDDNDADAKPPIIDDISNPNSYVYFEVKNNNLPKRKLVRKIPKKHTCKKCKVPLSKSTFLSHNCAKIVRNKTKAFNLTCDLCSKTFSDKYVLKKHQRIHSNEKPYVCDKCNRAFLLAAYLKDHVLRTHAEAKEFSCQECPKTFAVKNTLLKHIKRLHSGKTYTCDRCARAFNNNSDLKSHMVVHTSERPHVCATCGKAFKRKNQLNEHIKSHNGQKASANKVYACSHCDKKYSLRPSLFNHMKVHTGMLYTCDRCAVACRDRSTLKVHMLIHSDERPHVCPTCGKGFKRKSQLNEHSKVHTGERPYSCDVCDKTFTQRGSLNFHKRVHSGQRPYICEVCGRTFDSKYNMQKHLRIHTGERPYACEACPQRFTHNSSLHDHVRKCHDGERLTCDKCYKSFIHKSTLKKHMKIHLREK